ncbi:MAG: DNA mismatch repair endonuclease MutL [Desulfobulbaceae bacterium]|nr:DNA mismatch repair endonuclease MutL [Desulfobulbaceae bacterium]
MSKIKILPEHIANQIAAGEVVERPSSVVKEFVENGIDANATQITVEVEGGGTRLIRVIDNGEGMDADDILLCLERHGTSKIRVSEDLTAIDTLGFRGEAVPSIGSVAKLVIISRTSETSLGCQAEINYGTVRKVHEMGCRQGTIMEVRNLFGNVPARRKFLKTTRTELSHIDEVMVSMALAHPEIGFRYTVDGRISRDFPGHESLRERVARIYKIGHDPLVEINVSGAVTLLGYLTAPDTVSGVAAKLRVFVNGRAVRDRMVSHAVTEGGHGFYLKGRRPCGVLMLQVDPHQVDVNVHPTKQEIRFHRSQDVHLAVALGIKQALLAYQAVVKNVLFGRSADQEREFPGEKRVLPPPVVTSAEPQPATLFGHPLQKKKAEIPEKTSLHPVTEEGAHPQRNNADKTVGLTCGESDHDIQTGANPLGRLTYLGQFQSSYILCESDQGLVVIDQHAAHERLLFEKLKQQIMGSVVTQNLLFPEMMTFTRQQVEVLGRYGEEIRDLGLEIEHFGGESYVLKAVPALLGHLGPLEIVTGVFDRYLQADMQSSRATRIEDMLSVMACKAAIKANHPLQEKEGIALLAQMLAAQVFSHCPHGRPVYQLFSPADVKKWFLRT